MSINVPKSWLSFCSSYLFALAAVTFLVSGCAAVNKKTEIPSYGEAKKRVLSGGPLVEAPIEQRMNIKGGKQEALKTGAPAPFTGVLLNNAKTEELLAIRAEREKLRKLLEASRLQHGTSKIIYEATLERLKQEAERSWWEKNRGVVGLVIGMVLGIGTTVGLIYALTRGNALSTDTATSPVLTNKSTESLRFRPRPSRLFLGRRPLLLRF